MARTIDQLAAEGKRTKAEEWEALYAGLFNQMQPILEENLRLRKGQSRKHSFFEVCCSTAFGYIIALGTQYLVFPWFEIETSHSDNMTIALIFTLVSIIRSYIFRRLFNSLCK